MGPTKKRVGDEAGIIYGSLELTRARSLGATAPQAAATGEEVLHMGLRSSSRGSKSPIFRIFGALRGSYDQNLQNNWGGGGAFPQHPKLLQNEILGFTDPAIFRPLEPKSP